MVDNNKKSDSAMENTKTAVKVENRKRRGRPKMTDAEKKIAAAKRAENKKTDGQRGSKKTIGTVIMTLSKISKLVGGKGSAKIEVSKGWLQYQEAITKNPQLLEAIQKYR